jgi:predicted nucleic-acid-binding protein
MSGDAMRAVDTNVLVRLVTRDDVKQVAVAEAFVARGAWVAHLVLAEATWVLSSVYDRKPEDIASAVEMLLNHQHLTIQDSEAVAAAVVSVRRRPTLGFSNCLVLEVARKAGHLPLGTFDRDFGKLAGVERL